MLIICVRRYSKMRLDIDTWRKKVTGEEEETIRKYGDIINLPHPTSKTHPRMPAASRAAQFAPFAALTGLDDELAETSRYTEERRTLDENRREELDLKLQELQLALARRWQNRYEQTRREQEPWEQHQQEQNRETSGGAEGGGSSDGAEDGSSSGGAEVIAQITFFAPDEKKEGGAYRTVRSTVKRIDSYRRAIVLSDGTEIPAADICELEVMEEKYYVQKNEKI